MCLPADRRWTQAAVLTAAMLVFLLAPLAARQDALVAAQPAPGEIAEALEAVRSDPNIATESTIWTLRWRDATKKSAPVEFGWLRWIGQLFEWFTQSTRYLMWSATAILAVLIVVYLGRTVRRYERQPGGDPIVVPTHVRDLDIRPQSLPDDIGGVARQLWERGEQRAALVLLYRGLLSRLAHVYRVPIRDSSTEGDCLELAAGHAPADVQEYTARLIPLRQQLVYGARDANGAVFGELCQTFERTLGQGRAVRATAAEGAA